MSFILVLRSGYSASGHFKFSWTICVMVWLFGYFLVVFYCLPAALASVVEAGELTFFEVL